MELFRIAIEETLINEFLIEADDKNEAIDITIRKFDDGEFVLYAKIENNGINLLAITELTRGQPSGRWSFDRKVDLSELDPDPYVPLKGTFQDNFAYDVFNLINKERTDRNVTSAIWATELIDAARVRVLEFSQNDDSNNRLDGRAWDTVLSDDGWTGKAQYISSVWGTANTASDYVNDFMNNAGINAAILDRDWTHGGAAVYDVDGQRFVYIILYQHS